MQFEHWIYTIPLRLRSLLRRHHVEQELDEELRFHLEQRIAQGIADGKAPDEARYRALRAMQGIEQRKEECRDARRVNFIENLARDLRYGGRNLAKSPGFTFVAALTLALGIGANTAIFSVINAAILRPLPYPKPDRLVLLFEKGVLQSISGPNVVSFANFADWQRQSHSFVAMAVGRGNSFNLGSSGAFLPQRMDGAIYSWGLFKTLGVQPAIGRSFTADDDHPGAPRVAIISYGLWQRRFGGTRDILRRKVRLDGIDYDIIGVMAQSFAYPSRDPQVWLPIEQILPESALHHRGAHQLFVVARMRAGISAARAAAEIDGIQRRIHTANPGELTGRGAISVPLRDITTYDSKTSLYVLLAAVVCLLLIACVNISNLLLARGSQRSREFSIRSALGASRSRVVQQVLTESILLSTLGAAAGLLLAYGLTRVLAAHSALVIQPDDIDTSAPVQVDAWVLCFTISVSLFCGIVSGLLPARRSSQTDPSAGLKEGGRSATAGQRQQRLRHMLVGVEVALSVVLLIAAGLMIRSFFALRDVQPGLRVHDVLTAGISLPDTRYKNREQVSHFAQRLLQRLRALPGVESAALVTCLPADGYCGDNSFMIEGRPLPPGQFNDELNRAASPEYFRAAGIPLLAGRTFTYRDGRGFDDKHPRESAVIISESMAKKYWPKGDALGAQIYFDSAADAPHYRVIGIVGDVLIHLSDHIRPTYYTPLLEGGDTGFYALIHTTGNPAAVAPGLRAALKGLDPDIPAFDIHTMAEILGQSVQQRAFSAVLFGSFAGLALLLSVVGLYGVLSYLVSQQASEIGIRMALGAERNDVWRLVLRQGMRPALMGTVIGVAGAFALTRVLRQLLFGVAPTDTLTFAIVPLILIAVALLACLVPASRAVRIDPAIALRTE